MTLTYRGQQYAQHNAPVIGSVQLTYRGQHYGQHNVAATCSHHAGTYRGAHFSK